MYTESKKPCWWWLLSKVNHLLSIKQWNKTKSAHIKHKIEDGKIVLNPVYTESKKPCWWWLLSKVNHLSIYQTMKQNESSPENTLAYYFLIYTELISKRIHLSLKINILHIWDIRQLSFWLDILWLKGSQMLGQRPSQQNDKTWDNAFVDGYTKYHAMGTA